MSQAVKIGPQSHPKPSSGEWSFDLKDASGWSFQRLGSLRIADGLERYQIPHDIESGHQLHWQAGTYGKYLLAEDGTLHNWTTEMKDGEPTHTRYKQERGIQGPDQLTGWIGRNGQIDAGNWHFQTEKDQALQDVLDIDKRLSYKPNEQWTFGKVADQRQLFDMPATPLPTKEYTPPGMYSDDPGDTETGGKWAWIEGQQPRMWEDSEHGSPEEWEIEERAREHGLNTKDIAEAWNNGEMENYSTLPHHQVLIDMAHNDPRLTELHEHHPSEDWVHQRDITRQLDDSGIKWGIGSHGPGGAEVFLKGPGTTHRDIQNATGLEVAVPESNPYSGQPHKEWVFGRTAALNIRDDHHRETSEEEREHDEWMSRTPFIYHEPSNTAYIGEPGTHHDQMRLDYPELQEGGDMITQHEGYIMKGNPPKQDGHEMIPGLPDEVAFFQWGDEGKNDHVLDELARRYGVPPSYNTEEDGWQFEGKVATAAWENLLPEAKGNFIPWEPGKPGKGLVWPQQRQYALWQTNEHGQGWDLYGPHHQHWYNGEMPAPPIGGRGATSVYIDRSEADPTMPQDLVDQIPGLESYQPHYDSKGFNFAKTAALTRAQLLRQQQNFNEVAGPDQSEVVQQFPDGWTINRLQHPHAENYEGEMMNNCVGSANSLINHVPRDLWFHDNGGIRGAYYHSVRDPDNIPHGTFVYGGPDNPDYGGRSFFDLDLEGRAGSSAERYAPYVHQFYVDHGGKPVNRAAWENHYGEGLPEFGSPEHLNAPQDHFPGNNLHGFWQPGNESHLDDLPNLKRAVKPLRKAWDRITNGEDIDQVKDEVAQKLQHHYKDEHVNYMMNDIDRDYKQFQKLQPEAVDEKKPTRAELPEFYWMHGAYGPDVYNTVKDVNEHYRSLNWNHPRHWRNQLVDELVARNDLDPTQAEDIGDRWEQAYLHGQGRNGPPTAPQVTVLDNDRMNNLKQMLRTGPEFADASDEELNKHLEQFQNEPKHKDMFYKQIPDPEWRPEKAWSFPKKHVGGMTLPQQKREWNYLTENSEDNPETTLQHQYPDGWTIHRLDNDTAVQRAGKFMRNCWQGGMVVPYELKDYSPEQITNMEFNPSRHHTLNDEHGLPRVAFFYQPSRDKIDSALPRSGSGPLSQEYKERLKQWKPLGVPGFGDGPVQGTLGEPQNIGPTWSFVSHEINHGTGGSYVKGIVMPGGEIHTWSAAETGGPSHYEYYRHLNPIDTPAIGSGSPSWDDFQNSIAGAFTTGRGQGYVYPYGWDRDTLQEHLTNHLPDLNFGQQQQAPDAWKFGASTFAIGDHVVLAGPAGVAVNPSKEKIGEITHIFDDLYAPEIKTYVVQWADGSKGSVSAPRLRKVEDVPEPSWFEHPDPWMDNEPGTLKFPEHWTWTGSTWDDLATKWDAEREELHHEENERGLAEIKALTDRGYTGQTGHGKYIKWPDGKTISWNTSPNAGEPHHFEVAEALGHPTYDEDRYEGYLPETPREGDQWRFSLTGKNQPFAGIIGWKPVHNPDKDWHFGAEQPLLVHHYPEVKGHQFGYRPVIYHPSYGIFVGGKGAYHNDLFPVAGIPNDEWGDGYHGAITDYQTSSKPLQWYDEPPSNSKKIVQSIRQNLNEDIIDHPQNDTWNFESAAPRFDPDAPMQTGLPRPIGEHPELGKLPVPWSQADESWGALDDQRQQVAEKHGVCLLCGEPVEHGHVFVDPKTAEEYAGREPLEKYSLKDLEAQELVDGGPLHERCAKLTAAHCPDIKIGLESGRTLMRPYEATPMPQDKWQNEMDKLEESRERN